MNRKIFTPRRICVLALLMMMCMLLSACRDSPVLQEIRYTYSSPELELEQEMLDPEDEGEQDEDFENEKDDVETERDSREDGGLTDETGDAPESTGAEYSPNSGNDWNAEDAPSQPSQGDGTNSSGENEQPENVPGDVTSRSRSWTAPAAM